MKVGLIGSTGKTGGWALEECLERGHTVTALVRTASKLAAYADKITIVEGDATESGSIQKLDDVDVIISTIGSPNKETLVVKKTAEALVEAFKSKSSAPRVIWMTSTGINEATDQAKSYPLIGKTPSQWFFGFGLFGWLQFKVLIPYVIGQELWDDMAHSETVIRENEDIVKKTTIVRPGNMWPVSEAATFSEEWRKEGGADLEYKLVGATDPPPGKWIGRKAIAKALVDLVEDSSRDGTSVSLFQ
ncbi:NAD dependent epimerase dehydratase [Seminavis robusta]|uniref:NAD dependent epimerase dehydratase n=1 Tax=Seminavis robusta TaxID=568900 RepID=A0A9N8E834_9STRA|nr:NAD dependent epimerase dehydratase [Seminavis robusta]|eukprot:Sro722_g192950.1 NAD dependent epimerase dehydratase (246) ;mRNA; r:42285-43022